MSVKLLRFAKKTATVLHLRNTVLNNVFAKTITTSSCCKVIEMIEPVVLFC